MGPGRGRPLAASRVPCGVWAAWAWPSSPAKEGMSVHDERPVGALMVISLVFIFVVVFWLAHFLGYLSRSGA
ncbi:Cytochrome c oxidase subunit IIa family protein [Calidithermus terrae]|uniref:Cytochrome c oxidase subunit IIa family protein n=1 Tax=Calidithermus terrae TaxID=1408545 RepID=A0A399E9N9_9DEIN|nr:Cytochrome c oxidase subunit IIa family protein [Calidithermus terrae]